MKPSLSASFSILLILSGFASADTPIIRTTESDSSRVVFIAQTPLEWDRATHDSLDYIRFENTSVTDSTGYPELPMITCLVAMPDSVTPDLEFAWAGMHEQKVNPVYPAPAQVISTEFTAAVVDSFVQDSTAYLSTSFWPSEMVRIIGETRICGQRLIKVQLFPARYRASDSTLVTVSSISASLSFDSTEAVWSSTGLGAFQDLIDDSPIVGYHQVPRSTVPVPTYWPEVDPYNGPIRMPDYVIICASGLYTQCGDAIDDLAEHRVDLNSFDVALVTTDDILADFGSPGQLRISDVTIRDFTEHIWENWTQTSGKKPSYLLLIGDHEDNSYYDEPWFLPTHEYANSWAPEAMNANDEWYAYFNQESSVDNAMPDMFVGRLSVKNGGALEPDTLSTLIYNLIDLEDPITSEPIPNYRRRILRMAGSGQTHTGDYHQTFGSYNKPLSPWTTEFTNWLGYDYTSHYCGDGRWFTYEDQDLSIMKSGEWVQHCLTEFSRGAGVAFYTNHGELHFFSAGLEWCPRYYDIDDSKGCRDSTFNNYQIELNLTSTVQGYSAPFQLHLCCSAGTFNHTLADHVGREDDPYFCLYDDEETTMPYDFSSDCLAERILKNTDVPVAGVFCGSQPSLMDSYEWYGKGILEAIYARGHGRLGDAIASSRFQFDSYFLGSSGAGAEYLGQFNLLGDPALDISDRVRYPNSCDLSVYPGEFNVSLYPEETSTGVELPLSFKVRNNGAQDSDECDVRLTLSNGQNSSVYTLDCDAIDSGDSLTLQYTWDCAAWFQPPMDLTVTVEVDYAEECDDCWWGNNEGSVTASFNDTYPVGNGWILGADEVGEVISTTPVLANIDNDSDLEIIVLVGTTLTAFDDDGTMIWEVVDEGFLSHGQILSADLESDGKNELILTYDGGVKVISNSGSVLGDPIEVPSRLFVVGDMISSNNGLELCIALQENAYLYRWDSTEDEFEFLTRKDFYFDPERDGVSLACADLGGSSSEDIVYCTSRFDQTNPFRGMLVYDWDGSALLHNEIWNGNLGAVYPAAGLLNDIPVVGYPFGAYDEPHNEDPAVLIEPDGILEEYCAQGDCSANSLKYGVFANFDEYSGTDAFVLPSEMQPLAWTYQGLHFGNWPPDEYTEGSIGSNVSPTSLGNIDNAIYDDVLFSTLLDGKCTILAYNYVAATPPSLDIPITLPENVVSYGGFSIADIDRDGTVELVFGTSDGCLHCWELGSCTTGYAPWCQFQHDDGRTGVLE